MRLTLEAAAAALSLPAGCRDADAIKAAYRRAALATHPDKGGDPEAFKTVAAAYATRSAAARGEADSEDDEGAARAGGQGCGRGRVRCE